MKKSKLLLLSLVLFAIISFVGCGKVKGWETSGIHVSKKGAVSEVIIESFDEKNYDEKELEDSIKTAIATHNKEIGKDTISLEKFQVKDKKTKVILEYKSIKDYQLFNHLELYQGTLKELDTSIVEDTTMMVGVKDGKLNKEKKTPLETLIKENNQNYRIVVFEGNMQVEVDKNIVYASENLELSDKRIVTSKEGHKLSFIIYEI